MAIVSTAPARLAAQQVDYNRDIKPLLSDRCYACHGPDEGKRKAKLRLDLEGVAKSVRHKTMYVIKPGSAAESEMVRRISSRDRDERMPPPDSKLPPLSSHDIAIIRRWIDQGAKWEAHWSLVPLKPVATPKVSDESWPRTMIDRFILEKLDELGLKPAHEASKEKLIRRVTFDLTGLPPTIEQIDAFVNDRSGDAYEKLVDRLLASQRYGERMAVPWLDLARYSDTYGYQVDRERPMWPWRDWVIRAFNENLPYDQFITWQLAGDLLPNATDEQVLATAFNRLHPQKVEGGSVEEEFRTEYVVDRTNTFGAAFLGLTLRCARCHDHKYDPVTQKEYYQLFAFFNNIDESGLYSWFTKATPTPTLLLQDDSGKAALAAAQTDIAQAERKLATLRETRRPAFNTWLDTREVEGLIPGRIAHYSFDAMKDGVLANKVNPDSPASTSDANKLVPGKFGQAVRLTGDDGIQTKLGNFTRNDPFSVALWMNTPDVKERAVVFHRSRAWTDAGSRGYQLLIENGKLSASLIHFWPGNAIRVRTKTPIATNQWLHVAVTYDGSSRAAGLHIYVNGRQQPCDVVRDHLYKNITGGGGDTITIGQRFRDRGFKDGLVDEFQVFDRELTPLEVAQVHDGRTLAEALKPHVNDLSSDQHEALFEYYLSTIDEPYRLQLAELKQRRAERSKAIDGVREIMVMREMANRRQTYRLRRGVYDAPTDPVDPDTPKVLPPFPDDQPRNRLGLARWLTDPHHPLTARVAVNRFWQMCFGQGLVRTPEDFGSQGEPPTHPKLLDWLAQDFIDSGWDVKRLMKQMVMSAVYRQSSIASKAAAARDPGNRWLARAPRYRLPAEMIRDNALATGDLLVEQVGGPPARPYEVAVSFKPVAHDKGPGLYRRSVYTFWKRTGPAPVMMTFDAAKRDVCIVKRERTSTPLQALVLLNDPQFVEAARILAQHMIQTHGRDVNAIINRMFRALTSRRPTQEEQEILASLYQEQLARFEQQPKQAEALLETGEASHDKSIAAPRLAATTVLAQALMNYDECVIKR